MNRHEELEIVTTAYFLEDRLKQLRAEKNSLVNSKPHLPQPPIQPQEQKHTITPKPYPAIVPTVNVPPCWKPGIYIALAGLGFIFIGFFFISMILPYSLFILLVLLGVLCFPAALGITVLKYIQIREMKNKLLQERKEWIRNTPDYQNECRRIDEENQRNQEKIDVALHDKYLRELESYHSAYIQYEQNLQEYNNSLLPNWSQKVNKLDQAINKTQSTLDDIYSKNIIPVQYRNIDSLSYIAAFMSTSEYNLKFAIERFDTQIIQLTQQSQISYQQAQIEISREILRNQQYDNWLQEETLNIAENSNDILRSINSWQKADILTREYRRMKARAKTRH